MLGLKLNDTYFHKGSVSRNNEIGDKYKIVHAIDVVTNTLQFIATTTNYPTSGNKHWVKIKQGEWKSRNPRFLKGPHSYLFCKHQCYHTHIEIGTFMIKKDFIKVAVAPQEKIDEYNEKLKDYLRYYKDFPEDETYDVISDVVESLGL